MTLRRFSYLLILPPTLLLGLLFIGLMVGFERGDARKAEWERLDNHCAILESFLTLATDEAPEAFLSAALDSKRQHLLRNIPDSRFALFRKGSLVFAWPEPDFFQSLKTETIPWIAPTTPEGYPFARHTDSPTILHRFSIGSPPSETIGILASPNPNRVFLDSAFWVRTLWPIALLILAGGGVAEYLSRFLASRLRHITLMAEANPSEKTQVDPTPTAMKVRELDDLENALETLRQTLRARESEINLPPGEMNLAVSPPSLMDALLNDLGLEPQLSSDTHTLELRHQPIDGSRCIAFLVNRYGSLLGVYAEASRNLSLFDQSILTRTLHSTFSNNPAEPTSSIVEKVSGWTWIQSFAVITVDPDNNTLKSCIYSEGTAAERDLHTRHVRVMDPTHSLPQAIVEQVEDSSTDETRNAWIHALREFAAEHPGTPIFLVSPT